MILKRFDFEVSCISVQITGQTNPFSKTFLHTAQYDAVRSMNDVTNEMF